MQFSLIIASLFALATIAAPTPSPASSPACTPHCCQSLQNPDNMAKLLGALAIPRSDISGMMGIGCTNPPFLRPSSSCANI